MTFGHAEEACGLVILEIRKLGAADTTLRFTW